VAGAPRWGFHQLHPVVADRIVCDADIRRGDLVVDVGAGHGALTAPLVDAGARVVAVELHPGRADALRQRFGSRVIVVRADAHDLRLPRSPYKVVANPPFDATAAILKRVLQRGSRLVSAHIVVKEQQARRWSAIDAPGAQRWQREFALDVGPRLPRDAFRPAPPCHARVLSIQRAVPTRTARIPRPMMNRPKAPYQR
jgi:23S rRNA (adenine-N6)-dimethyltransferase